LVFPEHIVSESYAMHKLGRERNIQILCFVVVGHGVAQQGDWKGTKRMA